MAVEVFVDRFPCSRSAASWYSSLVILDRRLERRN